MMDDIFYRKPKKHVKDLNIVPILDMLVTVIFFLLISTSFIEYTKQTLPPSATVESASHSKVPPLSPRLRVIQRANGIELRLGWLGGSPGAVVAKAQDTTITTETKRLVTEFTKRFPNEKTLQISMGRNVRYQHLISAMDGARELMPDIVLNSYTEVDSL